MTAPDKEVHGSVAAVPAKRDDRLDACAAGLDDLRRRFDAFERRTLADEMPGATRIDATSVYRFSVAEPNGGRVTPYIVRASSQSEAETKARELARSIDPNARVGEVFRK